MCPVLGVALCRCREIGLGGCMCVSCLGGGFVWCREIGLGLITNSRVWGCPVYVLDPRRQDGSKLPKWTKKSRLAMYLGSSFEHASTVGCILHLTSGHVSPQYHVVYDEMFSTVQGHLTDGLFDRSAWNDLIDLKGHERLTDLSNGSEIPDPSRTS